MLKLHTGCGGSDCVEREEKAVKGPYKDINMKSVGVCAVCVCSCSPNQVSSSSK